MIQILWLLVATWSFFMPLEVNQNIVNKNEWVYMNDVAWNTWCNWARRVASHSFNKLWKKFAELKIKDKVTIDWCTYQVVKYDIVEIKWYDRRNLIKNKTLWLQTCADDASKYAYLIEARLIIKKQLNLNKSMKK